MNESNSFGYQEDAPPGSSQPALPPGSGFMGVMPIMATLEKRLGQQKVVRNLYIVTSAIEAKFTFRVKDGMMLSSSDRGLAFRPQKQQKKSYSPLMTPIGSRNIKPAQLSIQERSGNQTFSPDVNNLGSFYSIPPVKGQYKFSTEELRVLAQCNQESFFQRSLPIGTFLGLGTVVAIQKGFLKPSPRFGVFPKVTLAVVVGYFLGKLSYQEACAEKLMALPGSYIGQLLRERKDGKIRGTSHKQTPTMFGAGPNDIYSDAGPGSSLDLDTDRPLFNEDSYPGTDPGVSANPPDATPRSQLSYEELRRQNRGLHADTKQDPYKMDPSAMPPISRRPPSPSAPSTNKYGDVME